jgi:hypothetical protein
VGTFREKLIPDEIFLPDPGVLSIRAISCMQMYAAMVQPDIQNLLSRLKYSDTISAVVFHLRMFLT